MSAVLSQKRVWTYYAKVRLRWIIGITLFLSLTIWVVWEFSPQTQVRKSFARLVQGVENRDWKTVQSLIAADYRDQWGLDREGAIDATREILQNFLVLDIDPGKTVITLENNEATILAPFRVSGKGTPLADPIMERINSLREPFHLEWRRETWHPWSWKLVSSSQPALQFDASQLP